MNRFTLLAVIFAAVCFGQTATPDKTHRDASGGKWRFPESTFVGLPSAASNTGYRYTVTDCATSACTSGGGDGSIKADLRSNGSSWVCLTCSTGSGGPTCDSGTVLESDLTAAATTQEITILSGVTGATLFTMSTLTETTQFSGGASTALTVSMGRTGSNNTEMTGGLVPLMRASGTFWPFTPPPPQVTGTYNIVLAFTSTGANLSTFTAGVLAWRVCHY